MNCPKCHKNNYVKAGKVLGRQRFKCKEYGHYFSAIKKSDVKSKSIRRLALEMYLEGNGYRAIGRILKISHQTVFNWVKKWGNQASLPRRESPIPVVELDELHTYVGEKTAKWGRDCC
jgi:transposase-like protein